MTMNMTSIRRVQLIFDPTACRDSKLARTGTAVYVGYDDHCAQADALKSQVFPGTEFQQTNRAVFTKVQYLFRNN